MKTDTPLPLIPLTFYLRQFHFGPKSISSMHTHNKFKVKSMKCQIITLLINKSNTKKFSPVTLWNVIRAKCACSQPEIQIAHELIVWLNVISIILVNTKDHHSLKYCHLDVVKLWKWLLVFYFYPNRSLMDRPICTFKSYFVFCPLP